MTDEHDKWTASLEKQGMPAGGTWAFEEMEDGFNSGWISFGIPGAESVPATLTPPRSSHKPADGIPSEGAAGVRLVELEEHLIVPELLMTWSRLPGMQQTPELGFGEEPLAQSSVTRVSGGLLTWMAKAWTYRYLP